MTLLRNIFRVNCNIASAERCFAISKERWNAERQFGSKVELPSPPKRPLSAYMVFCKENRKTLSIDKPSLRCAQQTKIIAEKWSNLTEDMKKPYEERSRQSTLLYGEEHKKFYEKLTEEQKEELARLKAKKLESRRILKYKKILQESGLPKGPHSAYALFVRSEAKKKPAVKYASEFIKKVAELWNALPEESKEVFEKRAREDKMSHAQEMKEWRTRILLESDKKILKAYKELKGKSLEMYDVDEEEAKKKKTGLEKKLNREKSAASKN